MMKECTKCKDEKELSEFGKQKGMRDGHRNDCKACRSIYLSIYSELNKDYLREQKREYSKKEKSLKSHSEARKRHADKFPNASLSRRYYGHHKHKIIILDKCQECGKKPELIHSHHRDYNKPMEVIFLCPQCHKKEHKENTPLNRVSGIFTEKK